MVKASEKSRRLILVAHKYYNSLPAVAEAAALLKSLGKSYRVKLVEDARAVGGLVEKAARVQRVVNWLRGPDLAS